MPPSYHGVLPISTAFHVSSPLSYYHLSILCWSIFLCHKSGIAFGGLYFCVYWTILFLFLSSTHHRLFLLCFFFLTLLSIFTHRFPIVAYTLVGLLRLAADLLTNYMAMNVCPSMSFVTTASPSFTVLSSVYSSSPSPPSIQLFTFHSLHTFAIRFIDPYPLFPFHMYLEASVDASSSFTVPFLLFLLLLLYHHYQYTTACFLCSVTSSSRPSIPPCPLSSPPPSRSAALSVKLEFRSSWGSPTRRIFAEWWRQQNFKNFLECMKDTRGDCRVPAPRETLSLGGECSTYFPSRRLAFITFFT